MANVMEFPDTVGEFMELYRVTDTDHVYSNGTDFVPIFRMKQWFEHLQPKTNGDRIRSKSNEELAEYLSYLEVSWRPAYAKKDEREWLDWLKKECAE